MQTPYILLAFALLFSAAAGLHLARHGSVGSQGRTWLMIAAIFTLISAWLLFSACSSSIRTR